MDLSMDVWRTVLSFLAPADLVKVAQTCSTMRLCCKSLPLWTELRQELRLPASRRKKTTDYTVVMKKACHKCRFQKRMPDLPLCRFCVNSQFVLGRLRRKIQHLKVDLSNTRYYRSHSEYIGSSPDKRKYEQRARFLQDSLDDNNRLFDAELAKHSL